MKVQTLGELRMRDTGAGLFVTRGLPRGESQTSWARYIGYTARQWQYAI